MGRGAAASVRGWPWVLAGRTLIPSASGPNSKTWVPRQKRGLSSVFSDPWLCRVCGEQRQRVSCPLEGFSPHPTSSQAMANGDTASHLALQNHTSHLLTLRLCLPTPQLHATSLQSPGLEHVPLPPLPLLLGTLKMPP